MPVTRRLHNGVLQIICFLPTKPITGRRKSRGAFREWISHCLLPETEEVVHDYLRTRRNEPYVQMIGTRAMEPRVELRR